MTAHRPDGEYRCVRRSAARSRGRGSKVRSPWRLTAHAWTWLSTDQARVDRREFMSDMRLIVAGAGGRMGRTLIHAIATIDGAALAGAVDAPGSAVIGRDAGELAGLGKNGVTVAAEVEPLLTQADGLLDFTIPAASLAL